MDYYISKRRFKSELKEDRFVYMLKFTLNVIIKKLKRFIVK